MNANRDVIARTEAYLSQYVSFPDSGYALVAAMWAVATHLWPHFDAFPYMVVTSDTKQSGKTLFGIDLMSFLCANSVNLGGMTPAVAFRTIDEEKPTLHVDEAETLNNEAASDLRAALNMGYKRGAKFRRIEGRKPREFEVYCPKVFVLIGDVYDTLHDRSIILRMVRGKPERRFLRKEAEAEGNGLRDEMAELAKIAVPQIIDAYAAHKGLDFLSSRDEEIWLPLFTVCKVIAPKHYDRLLRAAVDFAAEKTAERRSYVNLMNDDAEGKARDDEYARRLVADLLQVIDQNGSEIKPYNGRKGGRYVLTGEALPLLKDVAIAPWRKYRGRGLTDIDMGNMLDRFGIHPKSIKVAKNKVQRGYRREDVAEALHRITE